MYNISVYQARPVRPPRGPGPSRLRRVSRATARLGYDSDATRTDLGLVVAGAGRLLRLPRQQQLLLPQRALRPSATLFYTRSRTHARTHKHTHTESRKYSFSKRHARSHPQRKSAHTASGITTALCYIVGPAIIIYISTVSTH